MKALRVGRLEKTAKRRQVHLGQPAVSKKRIVQEAAAAEAQNVNRTENVCAADAPAAEALAHDGLFGGQAVAGENLTRFREGKARCVSKAVVCQRVIDDAIGRKSREDDGQSAGDDGFFDARIVEHVGEDLLQKGCHAFAAAFCGFEERCVVGVDEDDDRLPCVGGERLRHELEAVGEQRDLPVDGLVCEMKQLLKLRLQGCRHAT